MVKKSDAVYFLGDLTGPDKKTRYWLRKLNGTIIFIHDNHDEKLRRSKCYDILNYGGFEFLLVHESNPDPNNLKNPCRKNTEVIKSWDGWIIHGHKHNNNLKDYPFINGDNKRINVSVELINYTPLNIDRLIDLDLNSIKRMTTLNSQPVIKI
jgi:calcineurin-like phosphoesterase family protein